MKPQGQYISLTAASRELRLTVYRTLRLVAAGDLRVKRAGKRLLVHVADVRRLADAAR